MAQHHTFAGYMDSFGVDPPPSTSHLSLRCLPTIEIIKLANMLRCSNIYGITLHQLNCTSLYERRESSRLPKCSFIQ